MTYTEAKAKKDRLYREYMELSKILNSFPKGEMGLTPDHVKFSDEFQKAKRAFDAKHKEYRAFNKAFMKAFKKEYMAERSQRLMKRG